MIRRVISKAFLILMAILPIACTTAPPDFPKNYSEAIMDTTKTRLGEQVAKWRVNHGRKSGFYPLIAGTDALGARLALIDHADLTIDAQYFLMKPDRTGHLFAMKLLEAADRGVRIRLLLDDIFTSVNDDALLVLNQHPNIEIRLFNPIARSGIYYLNYLGDFKRANRRMHNKSFTVDNQASIVGGRNIADEYFELLKNAKFRDFDMLALGPVATDISKTFDRFWNHKLSVPMKEFENDKGLLNLATIRSNIDKEALEDNKSIYAKAIGSSLIQDLLEGRVKLFPSDSVVVTDDPEKLLNEVSAEHNTLVTSLARVINKAESEVVVMTPYFIPGKAGVKFWRNIVDKGVRVVIVTNSLASNNHTPVHAGYARYRHRMIDAGVEMYELRVNSSKGQSANDEQDYDSVTLHTKGILIDRRYTFAGSLNLDPRSIDINTEMGVLIDNVKMTSWLSEQFFSNLPSFAYKITKNENGQLRWTTIIDGQKFIEKSEPQAGLWLRFKAFMSRILPENQL